MNNVRHLYTEWEENPDKMILRSKSAVTFLPLLMQDKPVLEEGKVFLPEIDGEVQSEHQEYCMHFGEKEMGSHVDSGFISVPESSMSSGSGLEDNDSSSHSDSPPLKSVQEKRTKYSPEQLKTIQARVKDSLKNQGVYLYDPVTGAGMQNLHNATSKYFSLHRS